PSGRQRAGGLHRQRAARGLADRRTPPAGLRRAATRARIRASDPPWRAAPAGRIMTTDAIRPGGTQTTMDRLRALNLPTRLRLLSGLTMFTFVVTHLSNHALGLISLDVMLAGQRVFFAVWHSLPGTALLATAFCTHLTLVLYKQVMRRTLRMPWVE